MIQHILDRLELKLVYSKVLKEIHKTKVHCYLCAYIKKIYAPSLNTITYSLYLQCSTSQTQFHLKQLLVSRSSITRKMTRRLNFSHIKVFFKLTFQTIILSDAHVYLS